MDNFNQNNVNYQQQGFQQQGNPQGYQQSNYQQQGYQQNNVQMNKGNIGGTQPLRGWSWGAFMFNIAWGIGNRCYLPLLCLIPGFNIIWIFFCGAKGHEWAMNSGLFKTVEEYNAAQYTWDRAGKIMFFVMLAFWLIWFLMFGAIMGAVFSAIGNMY